MTEEKMIEAVARAIYEVLGHPTTDGGMDFTYGEAAQAALRAVREAQPTPEQVEEYLTFNTVHYSHSPLSPNERKLIKDILWLAANGIPTPPNEK